MERSRCTDLLSPSGEEIVHDGEEKREEDGVGNVKRERQSIRRLRRRLGGRRGGGDRWFGMEEM